MHAEQTHLFIATPCYDGRVTTAYAQSLLKLQQVCLESGIRLTVRLESGDALISRVRQELVAHFLDRTPATHLLFVDADIGFGPEQVSRLLEFGADVSAGVYPLKRIDWLKIEALARADVPRPECVAQSYVGAPDASAPRDAGGHFAKVRYAGTGFLMIRRRALVAMIEQHPELRYRKLHRPEDPLAGSPGRCALFNCMVDEEGHYLSEDFSFCRRWTAMGGEIWADLESRLTHTGSLTFEGDYARHLEVVPASERPPSAAQAHERAAHSASVTGL